MDEEIPFYVHVCIFAMPASVFVGFAFVMIYFTALGRVMKHAKECSIAQTDGQLPTGLATASFTTFAALVKALWTGRFPVCDTCRELMGKARFWLLFALIYIVVIVIAIPVGIWALLAHAAATGGHGG